MLFESRKIITDNCTYPHFLTLIILNVVHWLIFESSQLFFNNLTNGQNVLLVVQLPIIFVWILDDLSYSYSTGFFFCEFCFLICFEFFVFVFYFLSFCCCCFFFCPQHYIMWYLLYLCYTLFLSLFILFLSLLWFNTFFHSLLWRKLSYLDCLFYFIVVSCLYLF